MTEPIDFFDPWPLEGEPRRAPGDGLSGASGPAASSRLASGADLPEPRGPLPGSALIEKAPAPQRPPLPLPPFAPPQRERPRMPERAEPVQRPAADERPAAGERPAADERRGTPERAEPVQRPAAEDRSDSAERAGPTEHAAPVQRPAAEERPGPTEGAEPTTRVSRWRSASGPPGPIAAPPRARLPRSGGLPRDLPLPPASGAGVRERAEGELPRPREAADAKEPPQPRKPGRGARAAQPPLPPRPPQPRPSRKPAQRSETHLPEPHPPEPAVAFETDVASKPHAPRGPDTAPRRGTTPRRDTTPRPQAAAPPLAAPPPEPAPTPSTRVADLLREAALPHLEYLARRLRKARHDATVQDALRAREPVLRFRFRPWQGPFEEGPGGRAIILEFAAEGQELGGAGEELGPEEQLVARYRLDPHEAAPTFEVRVPPEKVDAAWIDGCLLDFLERALEQA